VDIKGEIQVKMHPISSLRRKNDFSEKDNIGLSN